MNYLTHRFSSLTSLLILLVLSIGTAWLFHFALSTESVAESWYHMYAPSAVGDNAQQATLPTGTQKSRTRY